MFKLTVLVLTVVLAAVAALGQAPTLQIVTPDGPTLPADLYYGNVKVKPLRLRPGTNQVITIDDSDFFVNQQYVDFLNRFPDPGGFAFWNGKIAACAPSDAACIHSARIDVSNAFSFELEFGQSANYVFRLYRESFGNSQPSPNPDGSDQVEANKIPLYSKFKADRQVVVGGPNLAQQQLALATDFVNNRPEFIAKYPASLTLSQFVNAILATIQTDLGVDLSSQAATLNSLGSKEAVIYRLADDNQGSNPINNRPLIDAEYNRAFVYAQYGGYLRRDADIGGFKFWLGQVNSGPLRDLTKQRAMVCSFLTADEYQLRFGNTVTHHNSECN